VRRIVVIDAANTLYRAFFALPPLRNAEGVPTHAVLGFANMLGKVLREEQPDAVVVAVDPPGGSDFRRELHAGYKATRDAQPEDLSSQLPLARELIDAWGIPVIEVPGYEADDVIATLVRRAGDDDEVLIVSTDKDLMQLVGERVRLLDTMKDRRVGPSEVEERFGVPPEKLLDLRALTGDPSDNIPGVKGIGEKGAAKLLAEFGDLEELLSHADRVSAKRAREALQAHADEARLSKRLATLIDDVPISVDPARLGPPRPDPERLRALYQRLGFKRLLEALDEEAPGAAAAPSRAEPRVDVETVTGAGPVAELAQRLGRADRVALVPVADPAASGLPPAPAGLALAVEPGRAFYVPIAPAQEGMAFQEAARALAPLFEGERARWLGRDTKRLQSLLACADLAPALPVFDVELAAFLLDPAQPRSTEALARQHLLRDVPDWEAVAGRGAKARPAAELEPERAATWAAAEAQALLELAPRLAARLAADELMPLFEDVELPLSAVLSAMERSGVRVDEGVLGALSEEYEKELSRIEGRVYELAGERFTIGSPKQLQVILFEKLKLPVVKKTKTGYSTDESVLEQLAAHHDLPAQILAYRRLLKLKNTYVDALPPLVDERTGRIHPIFHQTGAATGRLSSSHPNVQNIPIRTEEGIRIREAFVAAEGQQLLSADYSQVELRILAHFSGDESLIRAFQEGDDVHRRTAADVAGIDPSQVSPAQRAAAKAINFGIIYGSSAFGIANQLAIAQGDAQATIDAYFARYRGVRRFLDDTVERARRDGFVRTLLGRRRYLPDLASRNRVLRQAAERMAVNTVIQGTAADLIKKAMVEVAQALADEGLSARTILQVHDELVFEAPPGELERLSSLVRDRMESVYALEVPLVVDLGRGANWREAH
jgi:DNA polymerase I